MKFLTEPPRRDRHQPHPTAYYRTSEGKAALARDGRFLELIFVADESEANDLIETYR